MSQSPATPTLSTGAKIAIGVLSALTLLLCSVTLGLTLSRGVIADLPTATPNAAVTLLPTGVPLTPVVSETPTSATPQLVAAPNAVSGGSAFAVFGSAWTPADEVFAFLRDPQKPSDPILPIGSAKVGGDGTFALTANFPTEARWTTLAAVDVIIQSGGSGAYYATPLTIVPATATLPPTQPPILIPTRVPPTFTPTSVPPTWTRVPPLPTATRLPPTATPLVFTEWKGEYFANVQLAGAPQVVRNDVDVNFNWGAGSPSPLLPADYFSARWTRQLWFPATQAYRLVLRADDGVRLWIDNALVLDEWHSAAPDAYVRDLQLGAGWHSVRIEYYESYGDALIQFRIENVPVTITDWRGDYFSNPNLSGAPTLTRNDVAVNFDWGQGAPDRLLPADRFGVRWTRTVAFDAGAYRFTLRSDDGVRLFVDGFLVINEWHDADGRAYTVDVNLAGGTHTLVVEYYENLGNASVGLTVQRAGEITRWRGEYFANDRLAGVPTILRNDEHLDFDWGSGAPERLLPPDRFSVRWTRDLELAAGEYRFDVSVDDAVRFWIDNQLVLDQWRETDAGQYSVRRTLTAGWHQMRLEYAEFEGRARFAWSRTFIGGATPTRTPTRTPTATATATRTPTGVPQPGLVLRGRVRLTGTGLGIGGVGIYRAFASYPPVLVATTDPNGNYVAPFQTIPGDEMVTVYAQLSGYAFDPAQYYWRHYYGYEDRTLDFSAVAQSTFTPTPTATTTATPTATASPTATATEPSTGGPVKTSTPLPSKAPPTATATQAPPKSTSSPTASPTVTQTTPVVWVGEYFNNSQLAGSPVLVRRESNGVRFNWGSQSPAPGLKADQFSVRWTRFFTTTGGTFQFAVRADDGVRVSVDGVIIIDEWHSSTGKTYTADVQLAAGVRTLRVEYYEDGGEALIQFSLQQIDNRRGGPSGTIIATKSPRRGGG